MAHSPSAPPVVDSLPSFPNEILTAVLEDPRLSQWDLFNCCRVSKRFVALAQPILFRHLRIVCGTPNVEPDRHCPGYILSQGSKLLFRTLEENKALRQYPRKLTLDAEGEAWQEWVVDDEEGDSDVEEGDESRGHYEFQSEFSDPSTPFRWFLGLLPEIDSVYLDSVVWWWDTVRDVVFDDGERWKEIKVDGQLLTEEADERDLRDLSRLEKLECDRIGVTDLDDQYLPQTLRSLHARDCSLPAGDSSSEYQLSDVLTALTSETITNLSSYRQLRSLHLHQNWFDCEPPLHPEALVELRNLPALQSLSLSFDNLSPTYAAAATSLLAHLPPSLSRLEFLDIVPFDILGHFVQHRSNQTPLAMGLREGVASQEEHKVELDRLATLCREHHIDIYSIPRPFSKWYH